MQQLMPLIGSLLGVCIVLDAALGMIPGRQFDFAITRTLFKFLGEIAKLAVRLIGNLLTAIGNAISGAGGGGGGGRGSGRR